MLTGIGILGDIETESEAALSNIFGGKLKADVLKVPHHGSATSSSTIFLHNVAPKLAVISSKASSTFGFPAPIVLKRYQSMNIAIARIDQLGAIGVRLMKDGTVSWRPLTGIIP